MRFPLVPDWLYYCGKQQSLAPTPENEVYLREWGAQFDYPTPEPEPPPPDTRTLEKRARLAELVAERRAQLQASAPSSAPDHQGLAGGLPGPCRPAR